MTILTNQENNENVEFLKLKKHRCSVCNKKTGYNYFNCSCNKDLLFCENHKFPFEHNCTTNISIKHKRKLEESHPKIEPTKIQKI